MILFLSLYLLYVVEQFEINLYCLKDLVVLWFVMNLYGLLVLFELLWMAIIVSVVFCAPILFDESKGGEE